jgi:hypothetical protein
VVSARSRRRGRSERGMGSILSRVNREARGRGGDRGGPQSGSFRIIRINF